MPVKIKPTSVIMANLGIEPNGSVNQYFTHRCRVHMEKYIPKDQGDLRKNVIEGTNYIEYYSPYAHAQYVGYTKGPVKNYSEPGTGPYWDKRMWSAEGKKVIKEVQRYIRRK